MKHKDKETYSCPECEELFVLVNEYLDGEVTVEARQELMAHVTSCADCARMLWKMERLIVCCRTEPGQPIPETTHRQLWETLLKELRSDRGG
ncbi:MAG: zf-HC2 domain-containing protein [candidate division WOR-3 bacterium]